MQIRVELEDGDRFSCALPEAMSVEALVKGIKEKQYLDFDTPFHLFTCPPLQIIKTQQQVMDNYS